MKIMKIMKIKKERVIKSIYIGLSIIFVVLTISGCIDKSVNKSDQYLLHKNITVTNFWIGEEETSDNDYIPNSQSAWDDNWKDHYGGLDDPYNRNGFYPKNFTPKENPFYFALPYNDFDGNGIKKSKSKSITGSGSQIICDPVCKNTWIRITKGNKIVYAQWEDVGPFEEDDANYVFGVGKPDNTINNNAGLDVSPAVRDYLRLKDIDKIDWQFVDFKDVPNGPWKEIITRSQIYWS